MKRRVVVTGGASISPLGMDDDEIFERLHLLKNCTIRMPGWDVYKQINTRLAAPIPFSLPEFPRKKMRGMGRVAHMAVATAEKALLLAGYDLNDPELKAGRVGVSFGSSMGNFDAIKEFMSMLIHNDSSNITATSYIRCMPQTCAVNISVLLGLTGRLVTTNTACTAGSLSIGYAYEMIMHGEQDVMIAGGAEELNPTGSAVFDILFATSVKNDSPEITPASYDRDRDGLVIGEGAGSLILEEYEHAKARGAHIYAEVVGFGTNTDGNHLTQPKKETMQIALEMAMKNAGVYPQQIGYVSGHGPATKFGDTAETQATFGALQGRAAPISSLKSYIGHSLGACGAIEAWLGIQMMNRKWFHPNLNLKNIDPACAPLDYIMGDGREMDIEYFMSNNFAFGGINTSLIFKRM